MDGGPSLSKPDGVVKSPNPRDLPPGDFKRLYRPQRRVSGFLRMRQTWKCRVSRNGKDCRATPEHRSLGYRRLFHRVMSWQQLVGNLFDSIPVALRIPVKMSNCCNEYFLLLSNIEKSIWEALQHTSSRLFTYFRPCLWH